MAGEPKAKVIPLHATPGRAGSQRRAPQRGESGRHPSLLSDSGGRASAEDIAAVVREIDARRSAAGTPPPDADPEPTELARWVAGAAALTGMGITGAVV